MECAKLSNENRKALLLEMHEIVNNVVNANLDQIKFCKRKRFTFVYPSKEMITDTEQEIIKEIMEIEGAEDALRKILTHTSGITISHLLNICDGMSDPRIEFGNWTGVSFADAQCIEEDAQMLHENFLEMYNEWKKKIIWKKMNY